MQPQHRSIETTTRVVRLSARRDVHNNVVQWRNDAIARNQLNRPTALPPELPPGEGKRHSALRVRVENTALVLVVLAAIFIAHQAGVL